MIRFICLFGLLANAVFFLWYSLHKPAQAVDGVKPVVGVNTLRLVSEIDPELLVYRKEKVGLSSSCVDFSGFDTRVSADAVRQFVYEQGFKSEIRERISKVVHGIRVIITMPNGLSERLGAIDYIEAYQGGRIAELDLGSEYILVNIGGMDKANRISKELDAAHIKNRIEYSEEKEVQYTVRVFEGIGRKLSNEIKEVVQESYSLQKNEKKVCEGVASLRATE